LIHEKTLSTRKGRFGGTYLLRKPEHPKKLKKLSFHYSTRTDKTIRSGVFRRWVEKFASENKDFQVNLLSQIFGFQEMETMSSSFISRHENELPSIMQVPLTSLPGLVARKLVHPLISDSREAAEEAEIFRPEWRSCLLVDGALYGYLTEGVMPSLLLYAPDHFSGMNEEMNKLRKKLLADHHLRNSQTPRLPESGEFVVAGYLKTSRFEVRLESVDQVALLHYDLPRQNFTFHAPSCRQAMLRLSGESHWHPIACQTISMSDLILQSV
jgi:hypothetical protein